MDRLNSLQAWMILLWSPQRLEFGIPIATHLTRTPKI